MPRVLRRSIYVQPILVLSLLLLLMSLPSGQSALLDFLRPTVSAADTFTVNSTGDGPDSNLSDGVCNDGTGACTLRAAIQQANFLGGDTINIPAATGTRITLTHGELLVDKSVTINGPGANLLTVSGNNLSRVMRVTGGPVVISGLTISDGRETFAAGVFNQGGNLTINNCTISNNTATTGVGGGISNSTGDVQSGTLTINGSTIANNSAAGGGGGLFQIASASLTNTTISGNMSGGSGGGINNGNPATLTNVTISGNSATTAGGGVYNPGIGTLTFGNTLIAGNTAPNGPDGSGANLISQDYNLIGNTTGVSIFGTTTHNITNVNALLGPLAANGGPTFTHALLFGSPAIDAGNSAQPLDQRGQPRPVDDLTATNAAGGNASDIGAFEAHTLQVNSTADTTDGPCTLVGVGNGCTLREAITTANAEPGAELITFASALTSGGPATITLLTALPDVATSLTITGPGANLLTVARSAAGGTPNFRILSINAAFINISGLTVTNGRSVDGASGASIGNSGGDGGGLFLTGEITLTDVVATGNRTGDGGTATSFGGLGGFGGGIAVSGTVTMTNVIVSNNVTGNGGTGPLGGQGGRGGGLNFNGGTLQMTNVTATNNTTGNGTNGSNAGASGGSGGNGGGISVMGGGTARLTNVTVSGNHAGNAGNASVGGHGGGISVANGAGATITNSTVNNNRTGDGGGGSAGQGGFGGGLYNVGAMNVIGSTISGNTTGTAGAGGGVAGSGGGGIYNDDVLIASNSTISGNTTGGLGGNGGGVNNHQLMWVTNCTVAFNNAITNTGNGIYHDAAGAGASNIRNTIVNHNGPSGRGPDTGGPFASQGHNLVGNADGSTGFTADGDQAGDSIGPGLTPLGPLANNGGPTQTHALLPGSTAIDAGDNCVTEPAHCGDANIPTLTTDQRGAGINRLVNGTVDIGAFESRGFTIVATNGTPQQATIGTAFGAPLVATVSSAFGEPFAGGVVAFVAPLNGLVPGATFVAGIPIAYVAVNATGVITSPAVNANTQAGSYDVLAYTANNSTTASFALTNLKGASSTAVSSSLNPVGFGQNVTFTGNVTSHVMAPTGVVQFKSNGNNIGTAQPLNGSGVATLTTSTLTAGTHTISADYSGDADYFASTGTLPATQVVTPSLAINDVSVTEGNSGTVSASFTVTLSGPSNQTVEVNFATANGTAQSGSDYSSNNGLLSFAPTQTSKPISITVNGDTAFEANETFFVNLSAATGATIADAQGIGTILNDDPQGGTIVFSSSAFSVAETAGSVLITVNRNGDATQAVTVDYATADLTADGRKDYTPASGTLQFDVGVVARTFPVLVNVDAFIEGSELVQLSLSSPTNAAVLGVPATATLQIDNSAWTPPPASSIDDAASFVRQHYHDFLNREPDAPGLAFWTNQITECQQPGATCSAEVRRINVSAAFFLSIEFQETGYLVYRMYKAGYDNIAGTPVPLRLNEFLPDTQQIGKGVQVGVGDWQAQLENNKAAFALAFVSRARFTTAYPTTLTPAQFVDALFANTGVTPSTADRNAAIGEFSGAGNTGDTPARARALRRVAENATMKQQETNRAFVLMQYFGYLRRNPNDAPEQNLNFDGYNFWLGKLNQFNGNFVEAEMVKAFIVSGEYRQRFGP